MGIRFDAAVRGINSSSGAPECHPEFLSKIETYVGATAPRTDAATDAVLAISQCDACKHRTKPRHGGNSQALAERRLL